jgi:hypothetical protein
MKFARLSSIVGGLKPHLDLSEFFRREAGFELIDDFELVRFRRRHDQAEL